MTTRENCFEVVELNVGGVTYATTLATLHQAEPDSPLATIASTNGSEMSTMFGRDSKNRIFIDRDGLLFRYILDYLRNKKLSLPENFSERDRLRLEADYYGLTSMIQALGQARPYITTNGKLINENIAQITAATNSLDLNSSLTIPRQPTGPRSNSGYIVIGYRGTFGK